jgi:hypothetical protein
MGQDEAGTLATLRTCRRELIDPNIAEHRGRIVKTTGDGLLVEFASVVDALRCAVEVQQAMSERNADVAPGQQIAFRIGINVGDIVVEDGDIFGDGVNVAARLEALAEPGGISVSARVQIIDKNGPAAELAARVVAIEYAGNAAMARLEAQNWRGTRYTDFLRVGQPGRWLADQQQGVFCPLARMKRIRAPAAVPPLRLGGACRARTRTMPVCPAL